jgi:hypothetical protein
MKTGLKITLGIAAASSLVIVALGAGWLLWGRWLWAPDTMGKLTLARDIERCGAGNPGLGMFQEEQTPTVVDGGTIWGAAGHCAVPRGNTASAAGTIDVERAQEAVEAYVADLGYGDLEIAELMEFERNYYAIVREHDTGIGAMELLVDRTTGAVGPEMGPNMMWNARYGMHRRGGMMMGGTSEINTLSQDRAVQVAQRWLDAYRHGVTAEDHADPFYGYYTIHTLADGKIEGMLSVHGTTGRVWYHSWHGDFLRMIEEGKEHG